MLACPRGSPKSPSEDQAPDVKVRVHSTKLLQDHLLKRPGSVDFIGLRLAGRRDENGR